MRSLFRIKRHKTIKLLNNWGDKSLIEKFMSRLEAIVMKTEDGYHDALSRMYDKLRISGKED